MNVHDLILDDIKSVSIILCCPDEESKLILLHKPIDKISVEIGQLKLNQIKSLLRYFKSKHSIKPAGPNGNKADQVRSMILAINEYRQRYTPTEVAIHDVKQQFLKPSTHLPSSTTLQQTANLEKNSVVATPS